jgi:hypothetical protein
MLGSEFGNVSQGENDMLGLFDAGNPPVDLVLAFAGEVGLALRAVPLVTAIGKFLYGTTVGANGDHVAGVAVLKLLGFLGHSGLPELRGNGELVCGLASPEFNLDELCRGVDVVRLIL